MRPLARAAMLGTLMMLAACASAPKRAGAPTADRGSESVPARPGGYYKDDGPGEHPPSDLDGIPDATPQLEPLHRFANRPYSVFGHDYVPATALRTYKERGLASWYGRRFHNQKTSTGETYDMYAMTAAHPTLPLPSYARVTSMSNGRSVVVRVNDRGPFHPGRVIDLSYAAAHRLGIAQKGSGEVEVESIVPLEAPMAIPVAALPAVALIEAAPPAPAVVGQEMGGYVVQLGAFANYANAQGFVVRLANQTPTPGVEARVHHAGGFYRVVVGPYATRDEAKRAADQWRDGIGIDATIRSP